ncbi:S8 family serine peptidase [Bacillus sp. AFS088145]|uniref:S8 family serine peptidase n=1 Tax=Bacillus sp. AFS088145 TaxID=2033514 RepID=UPI001C54F556
MEDPNNATSSHGVHVAGIAAESGPVIQGVAPEAQIIAEKVFSDHQAGPVAKAKVSSKSTFDVKLPKQSKGTKTINLYAIDNAGNKSHSVKRTIKVK